MSPVEIKKIFWAWRFKCGEKHKLHRQSMLAHEGHCFLNPDMRACRTCKHNDFTWEDYMEDGEYKDWHCTKDHKIFPTKNCIDWVLAQEAK